MYDKVVIELRIQFFDNMELLILDLFSLLIQSLSCYDTLSLITIMIMFYRITYTYVLIYHIIAATTPTTIPLRNAWILARRRYALGTLHWETCMELAIYPKPDWPWWILSWHRWRFHLFDYFFLQTLSSKPNHSKELNFRAKRSIAENCPQFISPVPTPVRLGEPCRTHKRLLS